MVEFTQTEWNEQIEDDCRQLVRLAVREDLDQGQDWTTLSLVSRQSQGAAAVVARQTGVIAGLRAIPVVLDAMEITARWQPTVADGAAVTAGTTVAAIAGSARDMLTAERLILNVLGHLSGIATLTSRYVQAIAGTRARIYDTRKTLPGWRRLEKYAVRCGGGRNHRSGLYDAVLIKDNHLALAAAGAEGTSLSPAAAVTQSRQFLSQLPDERRWIVEVEVDSLEQLEDVLTVDPDIVLLDNMSPDQLRRAVELRDRANPRVELEASGGIQLATVRAVAESGVDRISVGALTHSAENLDVGLDWLTRPID